MTESSTPPITPSTYLSPVFRAGLSTYHILGGIYAIAVGGLVTSKLIGAGGSALIAQVAFALGVGVFAIVTGVSILRQHPSAARASMLFHAAQIPTLIVPGLQYSAYLLLRVRIGWSGTTPLFTIDWGGEYFWRLGPLSRDIGDVTIAINLLALTIVVLLARQLRRQQPHVARVR